MSKVQVLLEDWKDTLLRIPGVTGVARGGNHVIVYVEHVSPEILRAIPPALQGVKVEVKSSGKIRLLSLMQIPTLQSRTGKWPPPILGGVSISCPEVTAGTLACRVLDARTGQVLGLSNNHVILGADWGEQKGYASNPVLQPGTYDGGTTEDTIGYTVRGVPVRLGAENLVDACVFSEGESGILSPEVLDLGVPGSAMEPVIGLQCMKSGRTTGTDQSVIESVGGTVDVAGWGTARFTDQIIFRPAFAQGGDSGSLVVDLASGRVIGIVFAGSDEVTAVCRASNVESLLGIRFGVGGRAVPSVRARVLTYPFMVGMGLVMVGLLKA